eukprot:COSAG02_NODE_1010_length_15227_cov_5.846774_16_plen_67_part_00
MHERELVVTGGFEWASQLCHFKRVTDHVTAGAHGFVACYKAVGPSRYVIRDPAVFSASSSPDGTED